MGKRVYRLAAAAITAAIGTITGAGVASAGQVQSGLADLSQTRLASLSASNDTVLANSIRQVTRETGADAGPLTGFQAAPPPR
jgi:FXSXX-COOH protein